jgi:alanine racemase
VAHTLARAGAERLAVATVGEALELRRDGIELPILVLWGIGAPEAAPAIDAGLETIVYDARTVKLLEAAAAERGRRASVQLKVDTGLGRQGASPEEALELASRVTRSRHLRLAGTFSHLAAAGEDDAYTDVQQLSLARTLDAMRSAGIEPGLVHLAATGGILAGSGSYADAVRPGIGLYGLVPGWAAERAHGLRPALSVKALPLRLFDLPAGSAISYGLRFRATRSTRIATLGIGYGDGWPRSHTNNGAALVRGRRVPVVGTVSMDGITVDVGEIDDVTYDDEFVLVGEQDGARISADEVAAERRTINYEVTTALRRRLPRRHIGA